MSQDFIRIISDVHGKMDTYLKLVRDAPFSIQLGDLDFSYIKMSNLDSARHKFIPGNHDNYNCLPEHALTSFGPVALFDNSGKAFWFYYVRGASSIDSLLFLK